MRYGISFGGRFTGMQMDIDRLLRQGVAKDNQLAKLANFNASQGARQSANEHLVPEQLFDNPETEEKEVEGISAVKALQIASEQGQKIFTITKENYNEAISQISLSSGAMEDIRNAINAGKQVTTHQSNINYKGWHGSGYIILDERTGAGAYLISGGANGAVILALIGAVLLVVALTIFTGGLAPIFGGIALTGSTIAGGGLFFSGITALSVGIPLYFGGIYRLLFIDEVGVNCAMLSSSIGLLSWALFRFGKKPKGKMTQFINDMLSGGGAGYGLYTTAKKVENCKL